MNGTEPLWVSYHGVPKGPSHPFLYDAGEKPEASCEKLCEPYYAEVMGTPPIPPGVYFRMLMVGYFEVIGSERCIAWKAADMAYYRFLAGRIPEACDSPQFISRAPSATKDDTRGAESSAPIARSSSAIINRYCAGYKLHLKP
ncbi:MAG: transposase [Acidobacteriota bacterium]